MLFFRFANALLEPVWNRQNVESVQITMAEEFAVQGRGAFYDQTGAIPFYLRAGKCLPVTCTEIIVRLRQPPTMYEGFDLKENHCRLRISPNVAVAIGMNSIAADDETLNQPLEIAWGHCPRAEEMDAYERVLGDAMAGDATLFAREDYVEEAWHR